MLYIKKRAKMGRCENKGIIAKAERVLWKPKTFYMIVNIV
jgi:hypothetical protein